MNKPAMRVTISEKWVLTNPVESIKSAVIHKYSDGQVILSVVKDLGRGDMGSVVGYKTVTSAKMTYARNYYGKGVKAEWRREK